MFSKWSFAKLLKILQNKQIDQIKLTSRCKSLCAKSLQKVEKLLQTSLLFDFCFLIASHLLPLFRLHKSWTNHISLVSWSLDFTFQLQFVFVQFSISQCFSLQVISQTNSDQWREVDQPVVSAPRRVLLRAAWSQSLIDLISELGKMCSG